MEKRWILFAITLLIIAAVSGCSHQAIIGPQDLGAAPGESVIARQIAYQDPMWPKWRWWQNLTSTMPRPWDMVVFRPDPQTTELRALRVVGLPGEQSRFQENKVLVNDQPVAMPQVLNSLRFAPGSYAVPENHYFLLSDDPRHTNDSRLFGPVQRGKILSRIDSVKVRK